MVINESVDEAGMAGEYGYGMIDPMNIFPVNHFSPARWGYPQASIPEIPQAQLAVLSIRQLCSRSAGGFGRLILPAVLMGASFLVGAGVGVGMAALGATTAKKIGLAGVGIGANAIISGTGAAIMASPGQAGAAFAGGFVRGALSSAGLGLGLAMGGGVGLGVAGAGGAFGGFLGSVTQQAIAHGDVMWGVAILKGALGAVKNIGAFALSVKMGALAKNKSPAVVDNFLSQASLSVMGFQKTGITAVLSTIFNLSGSTVI